jgi:hypothetical protein
MQDNAVYSKINSTTSDILRKATDNIFNIFLYILVFFAILGLGLFNWATLSFQEEMLTDLSYIVSVSFEVFCYGAIIGSFSVERLNFKKLTDVRYNNDLEEVRDYQSVARIKKVSEYVTAWNYAEKRKALLHKYGVKEEQARRKLNFYETSMLEEFLKEISLDKDIDKDAIVKALDNCGNYITIQKRTIAKKKVIKVYGLMLKQARIDEYVMHEKVAFDELYFEDLILKVGGGNGKGVNRTGEGRDIGKGTFLYMVQIFIGTLLVASLALKYNQDQLVDTIAKSAIMVVFVALSVVKGKLNGQRVFENNTVNKVTFMRQHLKEYLLFEAEKYNYKPLKIE